MGNGCLSVFVFCSVKVKPSNWTRPVSYVGYFERNKALIKQIFNSDYELRWRLYSLSALRTTKSWFSYVFRGRIFSFQSPLPKRE
jgi:hypothetical protein